MRRVAAALVVVAMSGGVARADDRATADALIVEGNQLGRSGELDAAIAKFKEAFHLVPRAFYACNIGLAYARKEEWARGHYYLALCRSRWDADEKRPLEAWVNQRLDEAATRLEAGAFAPVRVDVKPAEAVLQVSAFSADEPVAAGALFWLPFGRHTLTVTAAGYREQVVEVDVKDREEKTIAVTLEVNGEGAKDAKESVALRPQTSPRSSRLRGSSLRWVLLGGGAALLAAGGVTHVIALGTKGDAEELPPGDEFEDKRDSFRTQRKVAIALYGAGAIAAGIGLYMVLRGGGEAEAEPPPVAATTDGSGGMVTFQGRF